MPMNSPLTVCAPVLEADREVLAIGEFQPERSLTGGHFDLVGDDGAPLRVRRNGCEGGHTGECAEE